MKGHIPREKIEEIKDRANIVDIISEYVALKKAGRNYVGLCPFHREKSPSFTVNQDKQIFYCFGCQEGGNVFSFLMKINGMTFPEAVRHMADKMGVHIPREASGRETQAASEREKLHRINGMAAQWFAGNLSSPAAGTVRDYLDRRGMTAAVVEQFRLGYARDGWRYLKDFLAGQKVPLALVEKVGLIISKDNGQSYDRFRGRVMFPIEDLNGTVIAFGGRQLGAGEPKYLNSPESPVYTKGNNLYGLSRTKDAIRQNDCAVIVEGYFDLLTLWSVGITNVVATLGTALTTNQIALIRRFTKNVIAIFDPDEGGKHAVERSLPLFMEEGMHAKVGLLPQGNDPADYALRHGQQGMTDIITGAVSMVDYYIDEIMTKHGSLEDNIDAIGSSIVFISRIGDPIQRNLFIKRVSERAGIDQSLLKTEIGKALHSSQQGRPRSSGPRERAIARTDTVELSLVHLLLLHPERITMLEGEPFLDYFTSPELRAFAASLVANSRGSAWLDVADLAGDMEEGDTKNRILKLLVEPNPFNDEIVDRLLSDTVNKLRDNWYRGRRKALQRRLVEAQEAGDQELTGRLLLETKQLLQEERVSKSGNTTCVSDGPKEKAL